ncbi:MAG TPA: transaldolase family protein [Candidatus Babeliales bacterium]|nr:transaldolase family protein [Candidatus Babeliales bacterium]
MNLFLDTANLSDIKTWQPTGLIDGITTNPSLLSKETTNPTAHLREICSIMHPHDVSIEVTEQEPKAVYEQAKKIAGLAKNVIVKIPCHVDYLSVIKQLVNENIKINITLVFSLVQGLLMCKLGVYYISPFIGRLDDIDSDGIALIEQLRHMIDFYGFETKILAASIRHIQHLHDSVQAGADIATVPSGIIKTAMAHPLTTQGMTQFNADWQKLGIRQFP